MQSIDEEVKSYLLHQAKHSWKLPINGKDITIPKDVLRDVIEHLRFFRAENILDLEANYKKVSWTTPSWGEKFIPWITETLEYTLGDSWRRSEIINDWHFNDTTWHSEEKTIMPGLNPNRVYLNNVIFSKQRNYDLDNYLGMDIDLEDESGEILSSAIVAHNDLLDMERGILAKLVTIKSTSGRYHIKCVPLNEDYAITPVTGRGKRLLIYDITSAENPSQETIPDLAMSFLSGSLLNLSMEYLRLKNMSEAIRKK